MGDSQLRAATSNMSPAEYRRWFKIQTTRVIRYLDWLRDVKGARATLSCEVADVVYETIMRILSGRENYVLSGNVAFEDFFGKCLCRTVDSLRSQAAAAKRHFDLPGYIVLDSISIAKLEADSQAPIEAASQIETAALRQYGRSMRAMLARTRLRGASRTYAELMADFAADSATPNEIANKLGVKAESLEKFRKRIERALDDGNARVRAPKPANRRSDGEGS